VGILVVGFAGEKGEASRVGQEGGQSVVQRKGKTFEQKSKKEQGEWDEGTPAKSHASGGR